MKKISLRKIIQKQQGYLCRSKNTVLADYYFTSLDVLIEAYREAQILCNSMEIAKDIRRQILEKLWSIRHCQRIGQFKMVS